MDEIKMPEWKHANVNRGKLFGRTKPVLSERQRALIKKREELRRVRELMDPGLRPGLARELRKHLAVLEQEIAEI